MATFTLYEYSKLTVHGEPQEPGLRTVGCVFDAAKPLADSTVYCRVIPDVDARIRVSFEGDAATSADRRIYADVGTGVNVGQNARAQIYLISA